MTESFIFTSIYSFVSLFTMIICFAVPQFILHIPAILTLIRYFIRAASQYSFSNLRPSLWFPRICICYATPNLQMPEKEYWFIIISILIRWLADWYDVLDSLIYSLTDSLEKKQRALIKILIYCISCLSYTAQDRCFFEK